MTRSSMRRGRLRPLLMARAAGGVFSGIRPEQAPHGCKAVRTPSDAPCSVVGIEAMRATIRPSSSPPMATAAMHSWREAASTCVA